MLDQRDKLVDERKTMIDHKLRKAEEKRIRHIEGIRRYFIKNLTLIRNLTFKTIFFLNK